jgi:hypothetical protein
VIDSLENCRVVASFRSEDRRQGGLGHPRIGDAEAVRRAETFAAALNAAAELNAGWVEA